MGKIYGQYAAHNESTSFRSPTPFFVGKDVFKAKLAANNPRAHADDEAENSGLQEGAMAHRHTFFNPKFEDIKMVIDCIN